jgi:hypothetical protein
MWGTVNGQRVDEARYYLNVGKGIKYMAGNEVDMVYFIDYDQTFLVVSGIDDWWNEQTTILANPYPGVSVAGGQMKRAHSIAQGKPNKVRYTGSYIFGEYCYDMHLYELHPDGYAYPMPWDLSRNRESGSFPAKMLFRMWWDETYPYYQEDNIEIDL